MSSPPVSLPRTLRTVCRRLVIGFQAAAFWTAICLPVMYVPLLIGETAAPEVIAAVATAHLACLVVGHSYGFGDVPVDSTAGREGGY